MGSLFQSEEVALYQLFLQSEAAYNCISELGKLGLVQFKDLNPDVNAFQRKFTNEIRRCDEMERKLRYLEAEIIKVGLEIEDTCEDTSVPQPREMTEMEVTFEKMENELREINHNSDSLTKNYIELIEIQQILGKATFFFEEQRASVNNIDVSNEPSNAEVSDSKQPTTPARAVHLQFITGVVPLEKVRPFELMLWRACRGNVFLRLVPIDAPLKNSSNDSEFRKSVFIIFFQGDRLKAKVLKICEGFRATLYPCSELQTERKEMILNVATRIEDLQVIISQTLDHKHRILKSSAKNIQRWFIKVRKIKAIYHTLNLFNFDVTQKCYIGECWVPVADFLNIQEALREGSVRSGSALPSILNKVSTNEVPPTFNRVNKFTSGFQNLVNAYGVSSYREVNPATYTIITFPFLFAVMFGDVGHGLIVASFASWMVIGENSLQYKKITSDIWTILFGGRYIILLMGLFSIYTGLIYNDMFSKSLNIFGSSWRVNYNQSTIASNSFLTLDPAKKDEYTGYPYPFGMDPIWQFADNKIKFLNVYKMKISIIFGVFHMLFGVCLSLKNYLFFKNHLDIFTTFIPQILFLCCLFLYLVVLVFIKWIIYGPQMKDFTRQPYCAPAILITFINMVLLKKNESYKLCEPYMFPGQQILQYFLLALGVLCIPWMLLAKPIALSIRKRNHHTGTAFASSVQSDSTEILIGNGKSSQDKHSHDVEDESLGEIYIHQAIHTVEYVLGSVSHTASYLRLWALSLAHAQLSEVLWKMVFSKALHFGNTYVGIPVIFLIFAFWAVLTLAILVLMEGLSAFLHTLRLHWVEFQSKFYDGKGEEFQPFSFDKILKAAAEEK